MGTRANFGPELGKIPSRAKPAKELAALPQNVSCSDPLPPATQAILAGESENQGKVARTHGAREKRGMGGGGGEERKSLQLSPYILPNAVRPRTGGN